MRLNDRTGVAALLLALGVAPLAAGAVATEVVKVEIGVEGMY